MSGSSVSFSSAIAVAISADQQRDALHLRTRTGCNRRTPGVESQRAAKVAPVRSAGRAKSPANKLRSLAGQASVGPSRAKGDVYADTVLGTAQTRDQGRNGAKWED